MCLNDRKTSEREAVATDNNKAVLHYPGGEFEMDIVKATEGNDGFALGKLLATTGLVTFDPGYTATGATESKITFIDGDNGILRHRGYAIEPLAENASFNEVNYLLLNGELPTQAQLDQFEQDLKDAGTAPEDFKKVFETVPAGAHPMGTLAAAVNLLAAYHADDLDPDDAAARDRAGKVLMAQLPQLAAYAYRASQGLDFVDPKPELSDRENFLYMMFGKEADPQLVTALDKLLLVHADHEQNCSTSTVRMVASSGANIFASIAGGINALSGPLHGGANQAVLEMLEDIQNNHDGDATEFMNKVKNKEDGVRLMGFGHRVYKSYDPRAVIGKKTAHEVLELLGGDNLLDLAMKLEEIALADDYFVQRKLYPNVDFYTGLIYRSMGFPTDFFTVLFAIGRLPGWISQFNEQVNEPSKINRPRQIYTGETEREYVAIENR